LKRFQQRFQQGAEPLVETVPYGLPYRMMLRSDPSFRGACQQQVESLGIIVDFALPRVIG